MAAAVVTGAASGIGRSLARALAHDGTRVYLADVAPLIELARETAGVSLPTDVTDPTQVEALATGAEDARLICLNAGIVGATVGAPWEADLDEWHHVLGVNLLGVVNGLRAFVPRLLAANEPAHILITASLAGLLTFPAGGAYAATKHAVLAVAEQAALTLADSPVGVTVYCPALVRTGMSEEGQDPDEAAAEALAACREGRFVLAPEEWRPAIVERATRLANGDAPTFPSPLTP